MKCRVTGVLSNRPASRLWSSFCLETARVQSASPFARSRVSRITTLSSSVTSLFVRNCTASITHPDMSQKAERTDRRDAVIREGGRRNKTANCVAEKRMHTSMHGWLFGEQGMLSERTCICSTDICHLSSVEFLCAFLRVSLCVRACA